MNENIILLLICTLLVVTMCAIILGIMTKDKRAKELREKVIKNDPDGFVTLSGTMRALSRNSLVDRVGNLSNKSELVKLFNDSKNPWNLTPTLFTAIRYLGLAAGVILGIILYIVVSYKPYAAIGLGFGVLCFWYPNYYYKAIALEREQEWDKIYEFIWLIKNSAMLYDGKKVCLEAKKYISEHYPDYKEIINGFDDFARSWNGEKVPEEIKKYYSFPVPKELYNILLNMNLSGTSPEQSLNNLRNFALNKHNSIVQKVLSLVPSKATLASLPFLMASIIIALMVPMVMSFINIL